MPADSTSRTGEIDLSKVRKREQDEASAFQKTDRRFKARKERTVLISFRIKPEIRATMERISDAERISLVDVVERGIEVYDGILRGKRS